MKGRARLLALALLAAGTAPAAADTLRATALRLESRCGDDGAAVQIGSDSGLHGAVVVSGATSRQEAPAGGAGEAVVGVGCGDDAAPLTVTVPRDGGFAVTIDEIGGTDWHIGDLAGPLRANLRGSGDLAARTLGGGLVVDSIASADVHVGHLAGGPATFHGRGSGDLSVGDIDVPQLTVDTLGSGDARIGGGRIGTLTVNTAGSGDVTVAATADAANLSSLGTGDITVAHVRGDVVQRAEGSGTIRVNAGAAAHGEAGGGREIVVVDDAGHTGHIPMGAVTGIARGVGALLAVLFAVAVGATLLARRRRRGAAGAAADGRIAALAAHLNRLAVRASRLETVVSSREFELHRGFRELGE